MRTTLFLSIFFLLLSCAEEKKFTISTETIDSFTISEYQFEVNKIVKSNIKSGVVMESSYDTVLVNLCDFCTDECLPEGYDEQEYQVENRIINE